MARLSSRHLCFLIISWVTYLFFFRPGIAMRVSGDFDDRAYLCAAQKWVGVSVETCPQTSHFSGIAVTWFPAMILSRLFSFFTSEPFEAWAGFWVGLTSFFCWVVSLFLIEKISQLCKDKIAPCPSDSLLLSQIFPILFLLNIPVLYFATTRTFMTHTPELLWSLLYVYFLKKEKFLPGLISLGVLIATRPGNLGAAFLLFAFLEESPLRQRIPKLGWTLGYNCVFFIGVLLILKLLLKGYHGSFLVPMILDFQWEKFGTFLLAQDFGLLWSQPLWIMAFFLWILYFKKGNDLVAASGFWLFISALSTLLWPTRGGTFGSRYLIGSYAAVLIIFLESIQFWGNYLGSRGWKGTKLFLIFTALWTSIECWIYPAPKPFWPWDKPLDAHLGFPYFQLWSWLKQSIVLANMNRFSQGGQFLEAIRLISPTQFTRQGDVKNYALDGSVAQLNFVVTLLVICATAAVAVILLKRRRR